ncbi:uncharacterized protein DUF4123 [Cricetibacter osteomyelitidis]|uniref:Uncharacterized protein DUF4123 n=1 Tax=Cricetibacter osteomyelitidis TaxID=1521931 RepID=A0A4R2SRF3_9PAST|nr:DUF4123 domain-containing protein [Cricetibacter osteomyelitidis]TCP91181.1 uncharacterized protein DUF4123 [Cricetibacter osteomyelitidis]
MQSPSLRQIWAVDAQIFYQNKAENVVVLLYSENRDICDALLNYYRLTKQVRLTHKLAPLPFETYLQRHCDEYLIPVLREECRWLSDDNQIRLFNPNTYQLTEKIDSPCLTKTEILLKHARDPSPFLFSPVPRPVIPYLWKADDIQCYAIINAQTSFWFPTRFERDDIRSACLFKGEKGEKQRNTAPYLVELPFNHPFVEELFSEPKQDKENKDGLQYWRKNFGFFFCSAAPFEALLAHFSDFIYMPTYDERLLYFRFYDPSVLETYLDRLTYYPKKLSTFFGGGLIESIALPKGDYFVHYAPCIDFAEIALAKKQFDKFEMEQFIECRNQKLSAQLVDDMIELYPYLLEKYTKNTLEVIVDYHRKIAETSQLHESITLGFLVLAALFYGKPIDMLDADGVILKILEADDLTEQQKRYSIKRRIDYMETANLIQNQFGAQHG